ncbi:MAG: histidine phosphatase family protein [Planctomycetes bacterium]|nr:histidine phosphatase family protein [Planctomycetota bacterium]
MLHSRVSTLPLSFGITVSVFCLISLGRQSPALSDGVEPDDDRDVTLIYFLRHGEDIEESLEPDAPLAEFLEPVCNEPPAPPCCLEVLNDLGTKRAELLAGWFGERRILPRLTHVIASHKIRTLQSVEPIAAAAVAEGAQLAEDTDLNPGDGVQQVPAVEECAPGFESSSKSRGPMTLFIKSLPLGSVAVVGAHSPTIYPILQALGIDTSDPIDFPKDARGRVTGFGNIWAVQVDRNGQGRLLSHLVLDLELVQQRSVRAAGGGAEEGLVQGPTLPSACGDSNGDGTLDISDPIHSLTFLFLGGPAPRCLAEEAPTSP